MKEKKIWLYKGLAVFLTMVVVATALVGVSALGEFSTHCDDISQKVLRLHVLANSDSPEDQALKLQVRDAILAETGDLFSTAENKEAAMELVKAEQDTLTAVAEETLRSNGCDDSVTVELAQVFFDTRTYDTVTMPAGTYDAVQVKIGAAAGHNWWCVLFPSLCLPSATGPALSDVLTDEELDVVEQSGYDVRFQVVEWYQQIAGWFR